MARVLRWLQPLLAVATALFIAIALATEWSSLRAYTWQLGSGWLLASALLMLASWAVEIALWRALLRTLGGRLPWFGAARIWFKSAVVRYVPGNIWQPLSLALYGQQRGVRPEITVTSVALYQAVTLLAAAPIAAAYFVATGNWGLLTAAVGGAGWLLVALALAPVAVFLARPDLLIHLLNWALHKAGRPAVEAGLRRGRLSLLLAVGVCDWLLWGATFAALTFGIAGLPAAEIARLAPHLIAAYAIAYCIGFLSFITPSGFGVREGALYLLLATLMDPALVTVAALAMRVWNMLGEVVMALWAALTEPRRAPTAQVDARSTLRREPGA